MRGHVDAESLALYAEGQLSRGRTARVRAHLSGCAECGRTAAALAEVTTRLSRVPVPPVPAAVAARLDAALSAEAAHRAAAPVPAGAPEPRPPRRGPLWSPRALRILAVTGVTLVVAAGAGYAVSQAGSSSSGSSGTAGSAASRAAAPAAKPSHHSAVQAGPNISPGGPMVRPNTPPKGPRYARSGTVYQPGTLPAQAKHALAEYTVGGISGPGLLAPTRIPAAVRGCVSHIADGHPVLLVDLARYQQRRAIVIVLGDPDTVTAVSYSCTPLQSARLPVTSGPATG